MKSTNAYLEKAVLVVIILIPLFAIGYVVWSSNVGSSQAQSTSTTVATAATPTAAITLNNSSSLPTSVAAGAFASFSFTITNTGQVNGTIPYRVSVKWSTGEEDVIDVNTVSLAPGASQTIPEQLKFEAAGESAEVSLELQQTGQVVQFTLPRS